MATESKGLIFEAIPKIMREAGAIGKDRKNPQQGYNFRGIDDVYNAMQEPMARHGVFVVPKVVRRDREERKTAKGTSLIYTVMDVEFTFYAGDGSSVVAVMTGEAMDSGDKSANKAMSAAMKYAMLQVFCVPTAEPKDTENETHGDLLPPAPEMTEDEKWRALLGEAFESAGFGTDAQVAACRAICGQYGIRGMREYPEDGRKALLSDIVNGKFDRFKGAGAPAGK